MLYSTPLLTAALFITVNKPAIKDSQEAKGGNTEVQSILFIGDSYKGHKVFPKLK